MQGNWSFSKESPASLNDLDLTTSPACIRPETHWLQAEERQGRDDGRLWLSLQLSRNRAQELCDAFAVPQSPGDFGELIANGALMAPASYAALRLAIAANPGPAHSQGQGPDMNRMLGADLLVPPQAYDALHRLVDPGILEITDAGLAVEGTLDTGALDPEAGPRSAVQGPIPLGSPVIVAIIDDGIGIANHRFRKDATETRIKHFLDLSLIGAPTAAGAVPELLARSWTAADIDTLLGKYPDDEECVYRDLGLIDPALAQRQPLRAPVSHGTHMLDTAAGYDWRTEQDALADRPIIAVCLPAQTAGNRSDAWMPQSLKRALDWILVKADELSAEITGKTGAPRRLPLIVNCSFASMAGPQDGWSDVERRITQFVRTYRADGPLDSDLCTVVMSAGNSRLLRAVARVRIDTSPVPVPWRVLPDDRTPSFVQIWLPETTIATQQVQVALRPPGEASTAMFSVLDRAIEWTEGGAVRARLYHQSWPRPGNKRRECITVAIRGTADDGAPAPVVPAGLWHIDIEPTDELRGPLEADLHVHRDDVGLFARGKGRQSYFDDPNYRQVELVGGRPAADRPPPPLGPAIVTTEGTLNAYGYGEGTILVGGYRLSDDEMVPYSASGAEHMRRRSNDTGGLPMKGPDFAAAAEESPALPGVLGAGTYSGSKVRLNGTSVAAPAAVRQLADVIANGGSLSRLKAALAGGSPSLAPGQPPPQPSDPLRMGAGRLRLPKPTTGEAV